jgi:hypothetical protein
MRRMREELSVLRAQLRLLDFGVEAAALGAVRAEAEAARQEARAEVEKVKREAEGEVSRVRLQRDNALLETSHEIARANGHNNVLLAQSAAALAHAVAERDEAVAERDEAVAERNEAVAERDAAVARAVTIEGSGFWRLTGPLRRTLEALPRLHRLGRGVVRLAYGVTSGTRRQSF